MNIHSNRAAKAAGWRAREVHLNDKREATLYEVLKAVALADGLSLYDYIIEKGVLKNGWLMYVNGVSVSGSLSLKTGIKDNTQIHLMDDH